MPSIEEIELELQKIKAAEEQKKEAINFLKPLKFKKFNEIGLKKQNLIEEQLVFKTKKAILNELIAGIDSGFIGKNLFSLDVTLIRAVSVLFEFKENKLKEAYYYPSFYSLPEIHLSNNALLSDEFNCSQNIKRLMEELRIAQETIKKFKPKYCFLDGSIVPQYTEKPRKDSKVAIQYNALINEFHKLYSLAEKEDCTLIGCVEDSRGSRFNEILQENFNEIFPSINLLQDSFDVVFLNDLLKAGERTMAFSYAKNIQEHPLLKEFKEEFASKIFAFYLKPVEFDKPLRVEFLATKNISEQVNEIASIVFSLSCMHKSYAYPSILIEADLRARLKPEEINLVYDKFLDKLGKNHVLFLRRESRPF